MRRYEAGVFAGQGRLFLDGSPMTNDEIIEGLKERDRLQDMIKLAYLEGWSMGWTSRHVDMQNDSRVRPWSPPMKEAESDWQDSEVKHFAQPTTNTGESEE